MQSQVNITINKDNQTIELKSPYCVWFLETYRAKNGKFDRNKKAWVFPDCQPIRDWLKEFFGWYEGANTKEIIVSRDNWEHDDKQGRAEIVLENYGYLVAYRNGRDEQARTTEGCILLEGGFSPSGGSVKHPSVAVLQDTKFQLTVWDGVKEV